MHDDATRFCADKFEKHVAELFAEAERQARGTKVRAPITGIIYDSWSDQDTERAQRLACAALAACARFKKDFPSWPDLPVSCDGLDELFYDLQQRGWWRQDAGGMQVFLMYGLSQRYHYWPAEHPGFRDFVSSVLADERAPDTIGKNEELRKQFSPAPIVKLFRMTNGAPPGLDFLHWLSPEMAARDKAREAFHEKLDSGASIDEARREGRRVYRESLSTQ